MNIAFDSITMKQQEILLEIHRSINKISSCSYGPVYRNSSNALDFITDGESKIVSGFVFKLDCSLTIFLEPSFVYKDKQFIGINFNLVLVSGVIDFTSEEPRESEARRYLGLYKACLTGKSDRYWHAHIRKLHLIVQNSRNHLFFEFIPSHRLAMIVGSKSITKYQILSSVSNYILSNHLKLPDHSIRLDNILKQWFWNKRTYVSCDEVINFLNENSLLTQHQIDSYFQSEGTYYGKNHFPKDFVADFKTSSSSFKYLFGPIA